MYYQKPQNKSALNALSFLPAGLLSSEESSLIARRFNSIGEVAQFLKVVKEGGFPDVDDVMNMIGMEKSAKRVIKAIEGGEKIVIACDYDADGLGAASVLKLGLSGLGSNNVEILISDRYQGGYGFNQNCVDQIVEMTDKPGLVITVDEGSSDEDRIHNLKQQVPNIDLIVTDHHHVPDKTPDSSYSFINPNQKNDPFKHKDVCGAVVAFFLISAINRIIEEPKRINIKPFLEICAISTIGDVMPLKDPLNRSIVSYGLAKANGAKGMPFWREIKKDSPIIDETTIGFSIAPKINAMSRIGEDAQHVIDFLTSQNQEVIAQAYRVMSNCNQERKEINNELYEKSVKQVSEQKDNYCHVIFIKDGVSGVSGILASRIKEETGKPTICFCPKADKVGLVTGSGRSIEGVDIRVAVERVTSGFKDSSHGGHPAACGVTLNESDLEVFYSKLDKEVRRQLNNEYPIKVSTYDFDLDSEQFNASFEFIGKFNRLKPFGHLFEKPVSKITGLINKVNHHEKGHLMGEIVHKGKPLRFVWFNGNISPEKRSTLNLNQGAMITFVGELSINEFRGNKNLQVLVEDAFQD